MKFSRVRSVVDGSLNCLVGGWVVAKVVPRGAVFELRSVHGEVIERNTEEQAIFALQELLNGRPI